MCVCPHVVLCLFLSLTLYTLHVCVYSGKGELRNGVRHPVKLMKDGWYMKDGVRIVQPMTRMSTAGEMEPKGLKLVVTERGLLHGKLKLDCKDKASVGSVCCNTRRMMAACHLWAVAA